MMVQHQCPDYIEKITGEEDVTEQDNLMLVVTGLVVINPQIVTRDTDIIVFL